MAFSMFPSLSPIRWLPGGKGLPGSPPLPSHGLVAFYSQARSLFTCEQVSPFQHLLSHTKWRERALASSAPGPCRPISKSSSVAQMPTAVAGHPRPATHLTAAINGLGFSFLNACKWVHLPIHPLIHTPNIGDH